MRKKRMYESPHTLVTQIKTESGFCAASVIEKKNVIETQGHEVGTTIDATPSTENAWNEDSWN